MKKKELPKLAHYGNDLIHPPNLSQLSISDILEAHHAEPSIEVQTERELIRQFSKNRKSTLQEYGMGVGPRDSHQRGLQNKKQGPQIIQQKKQFEREGSERGGELRVSFSKDKKKRKKSQIRLLGKQLSAVSVSVQNKQFNQHITSSSSNISLIQKYTNPPTKPLDQTNPAPSIQVILKREQRKKRILNLAQSPLGLTHFSSERDHLTNPYHITPDTFKIEINDINSEFHVNASNLKDKDELMGEFHRKLHGSGCSEYSAEISAQSKSENSRTKYQSGSVKMVKMNGNGLDLTRETILSKKGRESPFSRSSDSPQNFLESVTRRSCKKSQEYMGFKRQ